MYTEFCKDRPYIQNEYEEADWNTASGLEPRVIDRMIRDFAAANPKMPAPLVMAHGYRLLLENAQLSLNPHTMFPDKLRHGGEYKTTATQSVLEVYSRERYENALMRGCPAIRSERNVLRFSGVAVPDTDVWHTVVDWSEVLRLGAPGLLHRAEEAKRAKQADGTLTDRQAVFYDAVIIAFAAMLTYMRRLLAEAEGKWYPAVIEGATPIVGDNGELHVLYACSGYWTTGYKLGQMTYLGGDLLVRLARQGGHVHLGLAQRVRNEQAAVIGDALTNRLLGGQRIGGATGGMEGGCHDESFCLKVLHII